LHILRRILLGSFLASLVLALTSIEAVLSDFDSIQCRLLQL